VFSFFLRRGSSRAVAVGRTPTAMGRALPGPTALPASMDVRWSPSTTEIGAPRRTVFAPAGAQRMPIARSTRAEPEVLASRSMEVTFSFVTSGARRTISASSDLDASIDCAGREAERFGSRRSVCRSIEPVHRPRQGTRTDGQCLVFRSRFGVGAGRSGGAGGREHVWTLEIGNPRCRGPFSVGWATEKPVGAAARW
jgi:hypothetical protein